MAVIKLIINPDTSKIPAAISEIKKQFSEIGNFKITVDTAAEKSTQNLANNLQKAGSAAGELTQQVAKITTTYSGLEREEEKVTQRVIETNEALGKRVRVIETVMGEEKDYTTQVIEDYEKQVKAAQQQSDEFIRLKRWVFQQYRKWDEEDAAERVRMEKEADAQIAAEMEAVAKQQRAAMAQLEKEQEAYLKQEQKAKEKAATEEKKRQDELLKAKLKHDAEEEKSEQQKTEEFIKFKQWLFNEYRKWEEEDAAEAEKAANRQAQAQERAEQQMVSLRKQYADFIRQVETLKAKYPEGTFDAIEREALEAQAALNNLDATSQTFTGDVEALRSRLNGLKAGLSETRQETNQLDKVTESFWMNIQKFARWYLGGNLVVKAVNSLREALSTMKEVDSELANIQKVTDRTDAEMQKLAKSAYSAASAYGVTAQAYLESAAEFAKAGFGERAEEMAEVAIKTQLVGDVSADIADKFLIAANAAWQMDGNIAALNKTLDAANIIENNYATSIEKLAQGMPIAASVAAQAGMTFDETIAALGTITSVTQETGTKAATALRALILNIIGAVGEYEDGIEVTEESVKSLDGLLQVYAKDALDAAKAAGTVINPMEAIAALAKASKEGVLNQAELFELLSSLGGKLRTNQLTALVENYETYLEMLDKTTESAGSADREIGIMLDTWEAKTNILKNTWTEFVTNFVNTDGIKLALDGVIKLVELLNTDVGRGLIISAGVPAILFTVIGAFAKLKKTIEGLNVTMLSNPVFLAIAAGTAAIYAVVKAIGSIKNATDDWASAAQEAQDKYKEIVSSIETLKSKSEELTEEEKTRLEILKQEAAEAERIAKQTALTAYNAAYNSGSVALPSLFGKSPIITPVDGGPEAGTIVTRLFGASVVATGNRDTSHEKALGLLREYYELQSKLKSAQTSRELSELEDQIGETTTAITSMAEHLLDLQSILGDELPEEGQKALEVLTRFISGLNKTREAEKAMGSAATEATEATDALRASMQAISNAADKMDTAIEGVVDALTDYGKDSVQVYDAMKQLEKAIPGSTSKLYDFETATWAVDAAEIEARLDLLDLIDANKQLDFSNSISQMERMAEEAWDLAYALSAAIPVMSGVFENAAMASSGYAYSSMASIRSQKTEWDAYIANLRQRKDYQDTSKSSTSTTRTETVTDAELERLKSVVALRQQELSYLKASGESTEDIVAKDKEIQAALHTQAEYMRSVLKTMTDANSTAAERLDYEKEILALSTEWWSVQEDINEARKKAVTDAADRVTLLKSELRILEASSATTEEINAKRKEIQAALHEEAEAMRAIGAEQSEINELSAEWWDIQNDINEALEAELEKRQELFDVLKKSIDEYYDRALSDKERELSLSEKLLEVQKAQVALANAQNERTVRYYNAATGQWEWAADKKTIKQAEEALENAEKALIDYQTELAWNEFKAAWEEVAEAVRSGEKTFSEAYDYMASKTKDIQNKYNVSLNMALEDSIGAWKKYNVTIEDFTEEMAAELGASVGLMLDELENFQSAVDELRTAFESMKLAVENGEMDIETAFAYLRERAAEISERYGVDMTGALEQAVASMGGVVTSIDTLWGRVVENITTALNTELIGATDAFKDLINAELDYLNKTSGTSGSSAASSSGTGGSTASAGGSVSGSGSGGSSTGKVIYGDASKTQNHLSAATEDQAAILKRAEEAKASGNNKLYWTLMNSLRTAGDFASVQNPNGTVTGYMVAISGAPNGEFTEVMNGKSYAELGAGTKLMDAWGNYWRVAENGVDILPDDGDYPANWYLKRGGNVAESTSSIIAKAASLTAGDGSAVSTSSVNNTIKGATTITKSDIGTQYNGAVSNYTINGVTLTPSQASMMSVERLASLAKKIGNYNAK